VKHLLIILLSILLLPSPVIGQSERPESIVIPVSSVGEVSDTRKNILQNTLEDELKVPSSYFYKDSFETISKKFFKGTMSFPTIVGIKENEYLFRFNGIDETILDEIKLLL